MINFFAVLIRNQGSREIRIRDSDSEKSGDPDPGSGFNQSRYTGPNKKKTAVGKTGLNLLDALHHEGVGLLPG